MWALEEFNQSDRVSDKQEVLIKSFLNATASALQEYCWIAVTSFSPLFQKRKSEQTKFFRNTGFDEYDVWTKSELTSGKGRFSLSFPLVSQKLQTPFS